MVNGEPTNHLELFSKLWGSYESFYGPGQHQAGVWNYRGEAVDISQDNTNIGTPFFLSSNGYGIFWNNSPRSGFNNRFLSALYLSKRKGTFPRMLMERRLQIVFVRENHGAGITAESKPDKVLTYSGKQTSVTP